MHLPYCYLPGAMAILLYWVRFVAEIAVSRQLEPLVKQNLHK